MALAKHIGLGSVVSVDHDADTVYTDIGLTKMLTPPPRDREDVDATVLADTLEVPEPGIEKSSVFEVNQLWHPGDTTHEIIDTLFGSKAKVNWKVTYPSSVGKTDVFQGYVKSVQPDQIEGKNAISRKFQVQRTGAITRS